MHTPNTQVSTNSGKPVKDFQAYEARIVEIIRGHQGKALTRNELRSAARMKRRYLIAALKSLVSKGEVLRTGSGTRLDSFRYKLTSV